MSVLGELEVTGAAGPIPLRALKLRRLLAALVISVGEVRSADALVDAVWGDFPPPSADKLLQVYVSRLRKLLGDELTIHTRASGYVLELAAPALDARRFEQLADEGRAALREGNPALAGSLLRRALDLWRGPAYGELADFPFACGEAARLEDLKLATLEDRVDADVALGHEPEVISEVCRLADNHPLRERLQAQAMLCLYRLGRHTEALERYAQLRVTLDQELGLEPGPAVRDLQLRILQHDPALAPPPAARAVVGPPAPAKPVAGLPAPANQLIGRAREVGELSDLLGSEQVRLVVLTGAGGSGKTRLAIEAARRNAHRYANGVAYAPLAAVRDPRRMAGVIAEAVGLDAPAGPENEPLLRFVSALELLLVVDNLEHLLAAASLLVKLLEAAPRMTLLATSRTVLHLSGENVYPVRPLEPADAVALFARQARAAGPGILPGEAEDRAVAQICERLDRLPLAIELAASRVRMLSAAELLSRLEPRLPLLTGGHQDLPARQRTMSATIAWSYELLEPEAQRNLRCLAVFSAGWTLDAAQAVCECDLEGISALLDGNLIQRESMAGGSRYVMLETVREYAAEKLGQAGEAEAVGDRHARWYLELAERCNLYAEAEDAQDFGTANREQENLRGAIASARQAGEVALALKIAVALENFWVSHDPSEGVRLLGELTSDGELPSALRARALRARAGSTQTLGELEAAESLYRQSREVFAAEGDDKQLAILDYRLGLIAVAREATAEGARLLEHSLRRFRAIGSRRGEAQATGALGQVARARGDTETAARLFDQSAAMCEAIGRPWWQALMLAQSAELALVDGALDLATARASRLLELTVHIGDREQTLRGLAYVACAAARRGDTRQAGRIHAVLVSEATDPAALLPGGHADLDDVLAASNSAPKPGRGAGMRSTLQQVIDEVLDHR